MLAPENLLLHLCLHLSYHHHFRVRLRQLADVWLTMERFVYSTLSLSGALLGSHAPPDAMASLARDAGDDELVAVAGDFVMAAPLQLPIPYREARASEGIGAKTRVYFDSLFPPSERLRAMYGVPPGSWPLPCTISCAPSTWPVALAGFSHSWDATEPVVRSRSSGRTTVH